MTTALIRQEQVSNILLRAMPPSAFDILAPSLTAFELPTRFTLADTKLVPEWIYFLESGVASVIAQMENTWQEVALFGHDGAGSLSVMLGSQVAPCLIVMQVAGSGYRIPVTTLRELFRSNLEVQDVLLRYIRAFTMQVIQSALANTQFNTEQRLARRLLMVQDRVRSDVIPLTHDQMAVMLGIGRTSVTIALHVLETARLISTARGKVIVLNRTGLREMVSSIYGTAETDYQRLLSDFRTST